MPNWTEISNEEFQKAVQEYTEMVENMRMVSEVYQDKDSFRQMDGLYW